jgi:hypothetical protein
MDEAKPVSGMTSSVVHNNDLAKSVRDLGNVNHILTDVGHKFKHQKGICMYTVLMIVFCVVGLIILFSVWFSTPTKNVVIIKNSKHSHNKSPTYTQTYTDRTNGQHSTTSDKYGNILQTVHKQRDPTNKLLEIVVTETFGNSWQSGNIRKSIITYVDEAFTKIAKEEHEVTNMDDNTKIMKIVTTITDTLTTVVTQDFVRNLYITTLIPKTGPVTSEKVDLLTSKKISTQMVVQDDSGYITITEQLYNDDGTKIVRAVRTKTDQNGTKINEEDITAQTDDFVLSHFNDRKQTPFTDRKQISGFTGDLPANAENVDITTGDYSTAAMLMSLDSSIYDQQKLYVSDRNRFSNQSSFASERDDANNLIPWRGIRRPVYAPNLVGDDARTIPSEDSNQQMTNDKQINWAYKN